MFFPPPPLKMEAAGLRPKRRRDNAGGNIFSKAITGGAAGGRALYHCNYCQV